MKLHVVANSHRPSLYNFYVTLCELDAYLAHNQILAICMLNRLFMLLSFCYPGCVRCVCVFARARARERERERERRCTISKLAEVAELYMTGRAWAATGMHSTACSKHHSQYTRMETTFKRQQKMLPPHEVRCCLASRQIITIYALG